MSSLSKKDVACPRCGDVVSLQVIDSLNVAARPGSREAILEGRFQLTQCSAGHAFVVESPFVYSDSNRDQLLYVVPVAQRSRIEEHLRSFDAHLASAGAAHAWAADYARSMKRRVVLGYVSLREKLRIWDAGLDDVVVEQLKRELRPLLPFSPDDFELVGFEPFAFVARVGEKVYPITVERRSYDEVQERCEPAVDAFVDWRREQATK